MKPKFKNSTAWQQAELLMQPALIRLLDNIRKEVEKSEWKATYENVQIPIPGYHLCLQRGEEHLRFDVWEMCYQICFRNYTPTHAEAESQEVEIDTSLIDETEGEVDWNKLDDKAKHVVEEMLANLPSASE